MLSDFSSHLFTVSHLFFRAKCEVKKSGNHCGARVFERLNINLTLIWLKKNITLIEKKFFLHLMQLLFFLKKRGISFFRCEV